MEGFLIRTFRKEKSLWEIYFEIKKEGENKREDITGNNRESNEKRVFPPRG